MSRRPPQTPPQIDPSGTALHKGVLTVGLSLAVLALGTLLGAYVARQDDRPRVVLALTDLAAPTGRDAAVAIRLPNDAPLSSLPAASATPAFSMVQDEAAFARLYEEPVAPERVNAASLSADVAPPARAIDPKIHRLAMVKPMPAAQLAWQRNAVQANVPSGRPMIAIVIDDVGLNRPGARRAIALPGPLTLSFMSYAENLPGLAGRAKANGHELMLHVPMEPSGRNADPGPQALRLGLPPEELRRRLRWALDRFDGFVGINNHMGSRFTASSEAVALVMREVKARGLLFLDSLTSAESVGWTVADHAGVPYSKRDIFLDHDWRDTDMIRRRLAELEQLARRRGYAVGIGHPHATTLDVLSRWLPEARRRGIALVPISAIVRHQIQVANDAAGSAG